MVIPTMNIQHPKEKNIKRHKSFIETTIENDDIINRLTMHFNTKTITRFLLFSLAKLKPTQHD